MNAPGTATRTTFLPFHSSVFSFVAVRAARSRAQRGRRGSQHGICGVKARAIVRSRRSRVSGDRGRGLRMPHAEWSSSSGV